jgi:hypothetical protein
MEVFLRISVAMVVLSEFGVCSSSRKPSWAAGPGTYGGGVIEA